MTVFCTDSLSVLMMIKMLISAFLDLQQIEWRRFSKLQFQRNRDSRYNATDHASIGLTGSELNANDGWFEGSTMTSFELRGD